MNTVNHDHIWQQIGQTGDDLVSGKKTRHLKRKTTVISDGSGKETVDWEYRVAPKVSQRIITDATVIKSTLHKYHL